jgi:hypothetical protein
MTEFEHLPRLSSAAERMRRYRERRRRGLSCITCHSPCPEAAWGERC